MNALLKFLTMIDCNAIQNQRLCLLQLVILAFPNNGQERVSMKIQIPNQGKKINCCKFMSGGSLEEKYVAFTLFLVR